MLRCPGCSILNGFRYFRLLRSAPHMGNPFDGSNRLGKLSPISALPAPNVVNPQNPKPFFPKARSLAVGSTFSLPCWCYYDSRGFSCQDIPGYYIRVPCLSTLKIQNNPYRTRAESDSMSTRSPKPKKPGGTFLSSRA